MIIKIVEDDYIELRIKLSDDGEEVGLPDGNWIEFKSMVRTREYSDDTDGAKGKTLISVKAPTIPDGEGKYVIPISTADYHIVPGVYEWELNLVKSDGKKTCLLPKDNNELIIREKVVDADD